MLLDNDMCDVKMPSLEGKAWAATNGDWVVYIGSNFEWELLMCTLVTGFHFQKSQQTAQRLSTPVFYAHSNTIMVIVVYRR